MAFDAGASLQLVDQWSVPAPMPPGLCFECAEDVAHASRFDILAARMRGQWWYMTTLPAAELGRVLDNAG